MTATRDRFRYRLSDSQIRSLSLAWAGIATANHYGADLPKTLSWDYLSKVNTALLADLSLIAALAMDGFLECFFFSHLMLARELDDFRALVKIWRKVNVEGDLLGDVYMACLHT